MRRRVDENVARIERNECQKKKLFLPTESIGCFPVCYWIYFLVLLLFLVDLNRKKEKKNMSVLLVYLQTIHLDDNENGRAHYDRVPSPFGLIENPASAVVVLLLDCKKSGDFLADGPMDGRAKRSQFLREMK